MAAKKKPVRTDANGYRILDGTPPVEKAAKALDRRAAAREVRDLIFGSSLPFASRQRIAELLDLLAGPDDE